LIFGFFCSRGTFRRSFAAAVSETNSQVQTQPQTPQEKVKKPKKAWNEEETIRLRRLCEMLRKFLFFFFLLETWLIIHQCNV